MPRSGRVSFAEGESPLDALQPPLLGTTEDGGSASSFSHKRRFVHAQRASSGGSAASTSPQRISVAPKEAEKGSGTAGDDATSGADPADPAGPQSRCSRIIHTIYRTRQTRDDPDVDSRAKTTLRELVVYLIFMTIATIVAFGMVSPTQYYYTKVMRSLFFDVDFSDDNDLRFDDIREFNDFWDWSEGPMIRGLFPEEWYNNDAFSDDELGFVLHDNKLLGLPRLRMLMVGNDTCQVHSDFDGEISECFAPYSKGSELRSRTVPSGVTSDTSDAWTYYSESQLDGSVYWGLVDYYGGGGYTQLLPDNQTQSAEIVANLKQNLWLERGTRVVFLDFTVYNANINLFCVARVVIEFPPTGGAIPSSRFLTLKLIRYVSGFDYFVLACEIIFLIFVAYYIGEEIVEINHTGFKKYFTLSVWSYVDWIIILLAIVGAVFNLWRSAEVSSKLQSLIDNSNQYANFEELGFWQWQYNIMAGVILFFVWLKLFKYLSFNQTMMQLANTLSKSAKDVAGFAVMFFIIFFAYAQLGFLAFGWSNPEFKTFGDSCLTLFRIMLGDFDFEGIEEANRILGPIYFVTFVFFVFFILVNMFLAIINDTYAQVKDDIDNNENEFALMEYVGKAWDRITERFRLRRKEVKETEDAVRTADANKDGLIQYEELRDRLRKQGHSKEQVTEIFTRYDLDGDRVLNATEQEALTSDLARMQKDIDEAESEAKQAVVMRRSSSRPRGLGVSAVGSSARLPLGSLDDNADFKVLKRRLDRLEHCVGSIVSKVDSILLKLEDLELMDTAVERDPRAASASAAAAGGDAVPEAVENAVRRELQRRITESTKRSTTGVSESKI